MEPHEPKGRSRAERAVALPPRDDASSGDRLWYKDAVFYELHVRSFRDDNGDGVGDFAGLVKKLDYLQSLGVTALWLLPFYPSPLRDDGYDISDYRGVHPSYGTVRDFRHFLREAHRRGLRVITELVLAHTSDEHPWFQRARQSARGSVHRDFYVWSDTPDRFSDARVIFKDFETSNWTFDPVAGEYFWHRFYSHQPALNYDNPAVRRAMLDVVDYWLSMGVDGLRLDAVPYLYAREGTSCENLPETFAFLRELRAHVDGRFEGRMLLAEANQWPEDAVAYMGDGDVCHMAFHFPLMPRMFMAARQEDRFPLVDILTQIPPTPAESQWALFLRNHDELTLEMVTDEERDYMYRSYAQDPQARLNVGIRRRLAPLLGNDRRLIEMMNGLLCSMPGTPILYYGDEIGMGDNIYLGDRNGVRTPMQWNADRNAGFSDANPQRLFLPVVIDPEYHPQTINVEGQLQSPHSLLWWMQRLVALRQRYRAFGRGSLTILYPENRKVFAFIRALGDERILCVFNLSRHAQSAQLDLSEFRGAIPVELFGSQRFPQVGDLAYFVTLGPYGFYWFSLETDPGATAVPPQTFSVAGRWESLFTGSTQRQFEEWLPAYLVGRRWFGEQTRTITSARILDSVGVPGDRDAAHAGGDSAAVFLVVQAEFDHDPPERYQLALAHATGAAADELRKWSPEAVAADIESIHERGVLFDAIYSPRFVHAIAELMARRRSISGVRGRLSASSSPTSRGLASQSVSGRASTPLAGPTCDSFVELADAAVVRFVRRLEDGVNPSVEVGAFLDGRAQSSVVPRFLGHVDYQARDASGPAATIVVLEERVPREEDGWSYTVDSLARGLEEALATPLVSDVIAPSGFLHPSETSHPFLGPQLQWASLLGQRTAELHLALASDGRRPDFAPEPVAPLDRLSLFHAARSLVRHVLVDAATQGIEEPEVAEVVRREPELLERLRLLSAHGVGASKIRCHGDLHLGNVLWTGRDFVITNFEGEANRSLSWRRRKRPPAFDLARMVNSLDHAGFAATRRVDLELGRTERGHEHRRGELVARWRPLITSCYLEHYVSLARECAALPPDLDQLLPLLEFFRLERSIAVLSDALATHSTDVEAPARAVLDRLDAPMIGGES